MALFKNLALAALSIVLGLAVVEAALWAIAPPPRPYVYPPNTYRSTPHGLTLAPDFAGRMDNRRDYRDKPFRTDAKGRRIVPSAAPAGAGARRLYLLGDSQTFGQGLADAETWAERLQRDLRAHGIGDVRVINLGVPGINVDQYHVRFTREILGEARRGDFVLVGLTWNDLVTDQARALVMREVGGYLVEDARPREGRAEGGRGAKGGAAGAAEGLGWRLRLYRATGIRIPRAKALKPFLMELSTNSALVSFLLPHIRGLYFRLRSDNNPFRPLLADGVAVRNFLLLADIARRAAERGLGFAVLFLPSRFFFEDAVWRIYSQGGRAFPARNYQAWIARPLCRRFALDCFDPFPVLLAHNREGLVFPLDGHYNARGARLIGDFAAAALAPLLGPPAP